MSACTALPSLVPTADSLRLLVLMCRTASSCALGIVVLEHAGVTEEEKRSTLWGCPPPHHPKKPTLVVAPCWTTTSVSASKHRAL
ncbi:hypothetical protein AAFF_G00274910 [Aldrovandia affinis]|uniref:Secreted protein n=1 Tax=Aldrovandia affinis TaxID=143900 RepID=A0AAD7SRS8_9TELE|nr:hypothetical protein AAFF_G00274910 [Aldrovandia affinis]